MSKLYFKYGAMNSGKTLEIMRIAHNSEEGGKNVILIKPSTDTKKGQSITSRVGISRKVDIVASTDTNLNKAVKEACQSKTIHCVLVDEAQFLSPQQIDQLFMLTVSEPFVAVMAFGLRTDFLTHSFPGSGRLFELAHVIEEIRTMCTNCNSRGVFNARTVNGKFVTEGSQIAIDGKAKVSYEPLCGKCYLKDVSEVIAKE